MIYDFKVIFTTFILACCLPTISQADLIIDGSVSLNGAAYNIIYDTTINITWLDYTNKSNTWSNQVDWAENLELTFDSVTYNDWRLPETIDGEHLISYDGTTTAGWNITSSELGHLFYEELNNLARIDTDGDIQEGSGLLNTDPFNYLIGAHYWSGTEYGDLTEPGNAWRFSFVDGGQYISSQGADFPYALAVHEGRLGHDTIPAPEPLTAVLLGSGFFGMVLSGRFRKRNISNT